jgi:hypothetical protein
LPSPEINLGHYQAWGFLLIGLYLMTLLHVTHQNSLSGRGAFMVALASGSDADINFSEEKGSIVPVYLLDPEPMMAEHA